MKKDHPLESSIFGDGHDGAHQGHHGVHGALPHDPHHDPHPDPHHDSDADPHADAQPGAGAAVAPPTRAGRRPVSVDRRRRRRQRGRRFLVLVLAAALVGGAGYLAVAYLRPFVGRLTESNDYDGPGSGRATVVVHTGDSGRAIGTILQEAGVVKTAAAFADAAKANPAAGSIQPGSYAVRTKMSAAAALDMLLDPANRTVPHVTIREGLWDAEVFKALSDGTGRPVSDYLAAAKDAAALLLPQEAGGNVQGYLFPATYEFDPDATAADQLRAMVGKAVQELGSLGVDRASRERTLVVASIVEAEARRTEDRPMVAQVIENRLVAQMPLQMDSTIHFIVQKRGHAGTTDTERAVKSPYNTYLVKGLPPGPIANPGLASLKAAIHPAGGPWLYFVTVNPTTGETRFATDLAGQQANEKLFLAWCAANRDKC